jgi:nucleoside-diphosphate-sugar epimerase
VTVLVTGATGFLGRHLAELLLASGAQPRLLVRPGERTSGLEGSEVDIRTGDVADPLAVAAAVQGVDRVLHCAARTGPWGPRAEYERTNIRGLETLTRAAMTAGVRRLVHVSSITVHGNDVGGEADERAPLRAEPNPYSWTKVLGERLLERLIRDEGARVTIVRPGWIYGPGDTASFARLAEKIERRQMVVVGAGDNHLPLIFARDAARGVLLASVAPQAEGQAYLLVNDEPVTQREFLAAISAELDVPPPTRRLPYRLAVTLGGIAEELGRMTRMRPPIMRYGMQMLGGENRFVISRARSELGFEPQVKMDEGVRRSIAWYRALQPNGIAVLAHA